MNTKTISWILYSVALCIPALCAIIVMTWALELAIIKGGFELFIPWPILVVCDVLAGAYVISRVYYDKCRPVFEGSRDFTWSLFEKIAGDIGFSAMAGAIITNIVVLVYWFWVML